ncbi:MAG TPA: antibiotic biosynthesis monooxygenase family protein [Mycobacterium sp.]|nr:antibiotic biosynthesis monooxygenase family protein [Mycobacterium sp.]
MSTHVVTIQKARPEKVDEVIGMLTQALPDSFTHDGCEAIHLRRDQDDPTRIVSFTQWATRQHYVDYLAWRTEMGMTDEIGAMLTEPMAVEYFDDIVSLVR